MGILNGLRLRRSIYSINSELPVSEAEFVSLIEEITELVPDAFNMKSARVAVVLGEKHRKLWDLAYDAFAGKVSREKIDGFRAGAGTVLYFYDALTVKALQEKVPAYAQNFPVWAQQANGMLQFSVWSALSEIGIGASLQHYNPVIDASIKEFLKLPESFVLVAQMPFGGIVQGREAKEREDIRLRVSVHG